MSRIETVLHRLYTVQFPVVLYEAKTYHLSPFLSSNQLFNKYLLFEDYGLRLAGAGLYKDTCLLGEVTFYLALSPFCYSSTHLHPHCLSTLQSGIIKALGSDFFFYPRSIYLVCPSTYSPAPFLWSPRGLSCSQQLLQFPDLSCCCLNNFHCWLASSSHSPSAPVSLLDPLFSTHNGLVFLEISEPLSL